ncbi:hypothetical protein [Aureimonas sp. SK2]|uniref:hypothetical protein n=1 Tax=Aureimonas sp. SK2 TaxID=3015992 RepID=UPI002443C42C|nr:hypothetical protein [Aureimonas sp. SK2]
MNVVVLPSARTLDASAALTSYIAKAKACLAFGPVEWDQDIWRDVTLAKAIRETSGKTGAKALHFLAGKGGARGNDSSVALERPFSDFLKAVVRLREAARPQYAENHRVMIRAGRFLHDVLAGDEYDPCRLLPRHFDEAARQAKASEAAASAYATGKMLAEIGREIDAYNLSRVRIGWKNTISRPSSDDRITVEAAQRRESRLPSQAALDALPRISALVTEDMDVLRMRVVELLVCGGWRINELLSIPVDCEVEEEAYENGEPLIGDDGEPVIRYGIRYHAEKGFGATIKWIPSAMVDVARRAVADCRRLTEAVRNDASWMHQNPGRIPIDRLDREGDASLTTGEVADVLGLAGRGGGRQWCVGKGITMIAGAGGVQSVPRQAMVDAMLSDLPTISKGFPVPLHRHMFLVRENALHPGRATIPRTVRLLQSQAMSDFITGRHGKRSIFAAFGFTEPDGSPIEMTTHQFRHWLNTLAQEGGLAQELVARWSGRKDMSQNAAYDHVSGRALAEHVRTLAEKGEMRGGLAAVRERLPPAERTAFLEAQIATAHVTEIGLCIHDWSLAPCPVHGDCSTCNEHVVDKGNLAHRDEAERQAAEIGMALQIAALEAADGTYGASRWEEAHRRKQAGLEAVIAIHADDSIPDGTLVHLGASTSARA